MSCAKVASEDEPKPAIKRRRKKYLGHGTCRTNWTQEDLWKILKAICRKYKGITSVRIGVGEICWDFQLNGNDLVPKKIVPIKNPSKKDDNP